MCDVQLAGKGIFQHTGASLVMAQLNDSSFIAEHIWTIPVSIFLHIVIHIFICQWCGTYVRAFLVNNTYVRRCITTYVN